jgi:hypothetical protein
LIVSLLLFKDKNEMKIYHTLLCLLIGMTQTLAVRAQERPYPPPVIIGQMNVPKNWQKGAIPRFSSDGAFVEGIVYARPWLRWTWKPKGGLTMGETLPAEQAQNLLYASPKGALEQWNAKYGWSTSQGKRLGSHSALEIWPTGISKDGAIVVGGYAADAAGDTSGETTASTANDGRNIVYFKRCFLWTRKSGFHDLWDYAVPAGKMEPKYIGGSYFCAVSPDGKKVVAITDRLVLMKLPKEKASLPDVKPEAGISGTRNGVAPTASPSARIPDLSLVLGRDFPAYQKYLGSPATVEKRNLKGRDGEDRIYSNPSLVKQGISKVYLGAYPLIAGKPGAVTTIQITFTKNKRNEELPWQHVLGMLGVSSQGVQPVEERNSWINVDTKSGGSFTSMNLDKVVIPDVPMASVWTGDGDIYWTEGFGMVWTAKEPPENNPTLWIEYHAYTPVSLGRWTSLAMDGAQGASTELPDKTLWISTTQTGKNIWSRQEWVPSNEINDGERYLITFEAKADIRRNIQINAGLVGSPYTLVGLDKDVEIGTAYKKYSFTFKPKGATGKSVKMPAFIVGKDLGDIYIRDLQVKKAEY